MWAVEALVFWGIVVALLVASTFAFRGIAIDVDRQADVLAQKFGTMSLPSRYRWTLPVMMIGMFVVIAVVAAGAAVFVFWGVERIWKITGSLSVFAALRPFGLLGAVALGVIAGTMVFPGLANAVGGETFRWSYLKNGYALRKAKTPMGGIWFRSILSAAYVVGAIVPLWISTADYVRVDSERVCRHRFVEIFEVCVPFSEIDGVEIDPRRAMSGGNGDALLVMVQGDRWTVAIAGLGSTREEIDRLHDVMLMTAVP